MKKILFYVFIFVVVFVIYSFNITEDIYYLSVGDYLSYGINNFEKVQNSYSNNIKNNYSNLYNYVNYSTIDDYRTVDLIREIKDNKKVTYNNKKYTFQNLLIKANFITLSIGMNDLIYKKNLTYTYVDQLLSDIDKLLILFRKYNKDKIYFLSFYDVVQNKDIIEYANNKLKVICKNRKVDYIDISLLNNYILNKYPTNDGYTYITDQILNFTK